MKSLRHLATAALVALFIATLAVPNAYAAPIAIDWVLVTDTGNVGDPEGSLGRNGAVAYDYQIMKYEYTNADYVEFLNAVDPNGTNPNAVYNPSMSESAYGGIAFTPSASGGNKYSVKTNMGSKPVNYVSWFDAARVANWLHNGRGGGSTESGAYALLSGQVNGIVPPRNGSAQFFIPTENEWYKAAYYSQALSSGAGGYYRYPTQSNIAPLPVSASITGDGLADGVGNFANFNQQAVWNGVNGNYTTVGTNGGPSAYGTFDMGGNVWEWNDLAGEALAERGYRGGDALVPFVSDLASGDHRLVEPATNEGNAIGFRLAAVPEPSTYAIAIAGLACGSYSMWRRRKRA